MIKFSTNKKNVMRVVGCKSDWTQKTGYEASKELWGMSYQLFCSRFRCNRIGRRIKYALQCSEEDFIMIKLTCPDVVEKVLR